MWQQTKNFYHLLAAFIANVTYGFPGRSLKIVGVTGTDGKTTTSSLIFHILRASGRRAALISTVGAIILDREYDTGFHVTTPGSFTIQRYLKQAKDAGVEVVVLEVTSHAIDQKRVFGIPFFIGLVTNVSHEHLDYHGTYQRYVAVKSRLLHVARHAILNKDDDSFQLMMKSLRSHTGSITTYGRKPADITTELVGIPPKQMIGEFNVYNFLAASAVVLKLGLTKGDISKSAASFVLPKGRTEIVHDDSFVVMIDFAHTPNAFRHLLKTLKKQSGRGRIIHVFGSAGERDHTKRRKMGEIASEYDSVIILTAEDPRSEQVTHIADEIASGIIKVGDVPEVHIIQDRKAAISHAVKLALKNDIVVITGKGHETSMNISGKEIPWSDHEAVNKALQERYEK